jgi:DNA-binding NarL/FixJ family response regulator
MALAAYVLKESSASELVQAVRQVLAARRYLRPPLSERAIETYVARAKKGPVDIYETLMTREREVLHSLRRASATPAIGERLGISPRTARTDRAHLMRKLGLRTKGDLIVYAINRRLVPGTSEGTVAAREREDGGTSET